MAKGCSMWRNEEGREDILPCDVNTSHITVTASSWWAVGPCEIKHLCRSEQCFPGGGGWWGQVLCNSEMPARLCGKSFKVLRLQCFADAYGSLFSFFAFVKIYYLYSWLGYTYKMHFLGLAWWSSGPDSMLPIQGTQVQSLIKELEPPCPNCMSQWRPGTAK